MVSDSLLRLRRHTARQAKVYQEYNTKANQIKQHPFLSDQKRRTELTQLASWAYEELGDIARSAQEDAQVIQQRANKRKVPATPEATAKVQRLLDRGGYDFNSLAQQLASEGDRAGLSALAAEIPYYAKREKLDDRQIPHLREALQMHESGLWDASEKRDHQELREALTVNKGFMDHNHKALVDYVDRSLVLGHPMPVDKLFHWHKIGDDGVPRSTSSSSYFNPADASATADNDDGGGQQPAGAQVHSTFSNYRYKGE